MFSPSYLVGFFSNLNDVNLSMQGMNVIDINCKQKIEAFKKQLLLWRRQVEERSLGYFLFLEENLGNKTISKCF